VRAAKDLASSVGFADLAARDTSLTQERHMALAKAAETRLKRLR
jgi:hypothetical protein